MWEASAGAPPVANLAGPGGGGRAVGAGSAGPGRAPEQGFRAAARRCGGGAAARLRVAGEPEHDLPGGGTGGATGRSDLAGFARSGAENPGEWDGRNGLAGSRSVALAVGGRQRNTG